MFSQGLVPNKSPVLALNTVKTHFHDMYPILVRWMQASEDSQLFNPNITHEQFTAATYKLYEGVYGVTPAIPPVHHTAAMMPVPLQVTSVPYFQPGLVPVCQSYANLGAPPSLPSHIPPAIPTITIPHAPAILPPRHAIPFVTTSCNPYGMSSRPVAATSNIGAAWEQVPASRMLKPAATPQVCTVPPTQIEQPTEPADLIVLVRKHGKKLPMYKRNDDEWLLVEDVQRMYFPRMTTENFLKKFSSDSEPRCVAISEDIDKAFRQHYQMAPTDHFEVALMISSKSLDDLMLSNTSESEPK